MTKTAKEIQAEADIAAEEKAKAKALAEDMKAREERYSRPAFTYEEHDDGSAGGEKFLVNSGIFIDVLNKAEFEALQHTCTRFGLGLVEQQPQPEPQSPNQFELETSKKGA